MYIYTYVHICIRIYKLQQGHLPVLSDFVAHMNDSRHAYLCYIFIYIGDIYISLQNPAYIHIYPCCTYEWFTSRVPLLYIYTGDLTYLCKIQHIYIYIHVAHMNDSRHAYLCCICVHSRYIHISLQNPVYIHIFMSHIWMIHVTHTSAIFIYAGYMYTYVHYPVYIHIFMSHIWMIHVAHISAVYIYLSPVFERFMSHM